MTGPPGASLFLICVLQPARVVDMRQGKAVLASMIDKTSETARLMKVVEVMVAELARQGVVETLADLDFDPMALAKVVIKAADGDVIDLNSRRDQW